MAEMMRFPIGAEVSCSDGVCGDLTRVVLDPAARTVTHLVVEPKHRTGLARLVPIGIVDETVNDLRLRCSTAEFEKLPGAEETEFLPGQVGLPYYGLGVDMGIGVGNTIEPIVHDRIPMGEVEVRRGEQVHATDGPIGKVQGLVIDPADHHVTHVLLQEGHLWGRKQVAIPIKAVTTVNEGIHLSLTKEEVQGLPPVSIDHPVGD